MPHWKSLAWIFLCLNVMMLLLSGCTDMQAQKVQAYWHRHDKPKISYYPFLSRSQYDFLDAQNRVGIFPGEVIVPKHEAGDLEYTLNANSWWGYWPREVILSNYFVAEQAKRILGCGYLPAGTVFTIPRGVYTFKKTKFSIAYPLMWKLNTALSSMCQTPSNLPIEYFEKDSLYWRVPYSQDRIYP